MIGLIFVITIVGNALAMNHYTEISFGWIALASVVVALVAAAFAALITQIIFPKRTG